MTPSRLLVPILLVVSTAVLADFRIESNDAGNRLLHVAVVNSTQAAASNVQLSYFGDIRGKPSVTPIGICDLCITHIVALYANDAAEHGEFAEAQNYLGDAQPNGSGFVLTFNGDLRGKYITALATRWVNGVGSDLFDTAELSKAFLVQ